MCKLICWTSISCYPIFSICRSYLASLFLSVPSSWRYLTFGFFFVLFMIFSRDYSRHAHCISVNTIIFPPVCFGIPFLRPVDRLHTVRDCSNTLFFYICFFFSLIYDSPPHPHGFFFAPQSNVRFFRYRPFWQVSFFFFFVFFVFFFLWYVTSRNVGRVPFASVVNPKDPSLWAPPILVVSLGFLLSSGHPRALEHLIREGLLSLCQNEVNQRKACPLYRI